ncbi:MAG: hypothetical protein KC910_11540 [Candidatus Eremiobacteraeota bacterium]|nr:hypothetical protein [Candidatus Eremiobacteraeota bacterium]
MSDDPLEYFRSGGRLDSSGTFTVNPERALEVLAQHQYAQPEEVVLTLLSWAIGAGAHRVDFSGSGLFEHDGRSPDRLQLENLLVYVGGASQPELGLLALAHYYLRSYGATYESGEGLRLVWKNGSATLEECPPAKRRNRFSWRRSGRYAEFLRQVCSLAPLELVVDGQRLEPTWKLGTDHAVVEFGVVPLDLSEVPRRLREEWAFDYTGLLVAGPRPEGLAEGNVVVGGMGYVVDFQLPAGMWALVWADSLPRSLSFELVGGDWLQPLSQALEKAGRRFLGELVGGLVALPRPLVESLLPSLIELAGQLQSAAPRQALSLAEKALEFEPDNMGLLMQSLELLVTLGRHEEVSLRVCSLAKRHGSKMVTSDFYRVVGRLAQVEDDESLSGLQNALEQTVGRDSPLHLPILTRLGDRFARRGGLIEAEYYYYHALMSALRVTRPAFVSYPYHSVLDFERGEPEWFDRLQELHRDALPALFQLVELAHLRHSPQPKLTRLLVSRRLSARSSEMLGDSIYIEARQKLWSRLKALTIYSRTGRVGALARPEELPDATAAIAHYRQALVLGDHPEPGRLWWKIARVSALRLEYLRRASQLAGPNASRELETVRLKMALNSLEAEVTQAFQQARNVNGHDHRWEAEALIELGRRERAEQIVAELLLGLPARHPDKLCLLVDLAILRQGRSLDQALGAVWGLLRTSPGAFEGDSPVEMLASRCPWPFPVELPERLRRLADEVGEPRRRMILRMAQVLCYRLVRGDWGQGNLMGLVRAGLDKLGR